MLAIVMSLAAAAAPPAAAATEAASLSIPAAQHYLAPATLAAYRDAALRGDAVRAGQLAEYYEYFLSDSVDAEFWARLAAEHGGCQALVDYLPYLREQPRLNDPQRQREWRERKESACASESKPAAQP